VTTHRPELERLSTSEIAFLARMKPETVRRKLTAVGLEPVAVDRRSRRWDPRDALPILLGVGDGLNPQAERARLDRARAELAELKLEEERGELVRGAAVESWLVRLLGAVTQRIRAIPPKAAPEVRATPSDATGEAVLAGFIDEALTELADAAREAGERATRRGEAVA